MPDIIIDNRQAIPVRLIPFVTGWQLSPDTVINIMADHDDLFQISLSTYHLQSDNSYPLMLPKEWDVFITDIEALKDRLDQSETYHNEKYTEWREESPKLIPPGTFVWLDELEAAYKKACIEEKIPFDEERPGDCDLNLTPFIKPEMQSLVLEGFERMLTSNLPHNQDEDVIDIQPKYSENSPPTDENDEDLSEYFDSLPLKGIAMMFRISQDDNINLNKWRTYAGKASANGLSNSRSKTSSGPSESTFNPWSVSEWLITRGLFTREKAERILSRNLPSRSAHLKDILFQ